MSPESKQRAVGVIVLIAFIALLIPFLFTSGIKKKPQSVGEEAVSVPVAEVNATADNKQPVLNDEQQSTILPKLPEEVSGKSLPDNLQQQSASSAQSVVLPPEPLENQAVADNRGQEPSAGVIPPQKAVPPIPAAPVVANVSTELAAPASPSPVKVANVESKVAAAQTIPPKPTLKNQKKASVKNKTAVVNKKAKGLIKGAKIWSVQVGSFSDQPRMQKMVDDLQAKGFKVYLQKINTSHGLMVRVLVGCENNKDKAIKISKQLQTKLNINGRVVGNKK